VEKGQVRGSKEDEENVEERNKPKNSESEKVILAKEECGNPKTKTLTYLLVKMLEGLVSGRRERRKFGEGDGEMEKGGGRNLRLEVGRKQPLQKRETK
jgi:hypothetical protein